MTEEIGGHYNAMLDACDEYDTRIEAAGDDPALRKAAEDWLIEQNGIWKKSLRVSTSGVTPVAHRLPSCSSLADRVPQAFQTRSGKKKTKKAAGKGSAGGSQEALVREVRDLKKIQLGRFELERAVSLLLLRSPRARLRLTACVTRRPC